MMPIDPIQLADGENKQNMPDFIDENPNLEMVLEGLDASEDELRDAADDEYGIDPSLPISDSLVENDGDVAPEVAAMHIDRTPIEDDSI